MLRYTLKTKCFIQDKSKQDVLFNCTEESASVSKCVTFKTQNFDCLEATLSCYDGVHIPGMASGDIVLLLYFLGM